MKLPAPSDIRVILPDLHGNHVALMKMLRGVGALTAEGERVPGFWVCALGDVVHGGHNVTDADRVTLELACEYGWVDAAVLGNHELPFVTSLPSAFVGMHGEGGRAYHPSCQAELNRAFRAGFFTAALAVDGWLLTHAGFSPEHLYDDEEHPTNHDLRAALRTEDPARSLADCINDRFEKRLMTHARDIVIDGVSSWRGGVSAVGSVFWADLNEVVHDARKHGNPVAQVIGHTPRPDSKHKLFAFPFELELGHHPLLSVDLAGIDDGFIGCVTKRALDREWTSHVITRPVRPSGGVTAASYCSRARNTAFSSEESG